MATTSLTQGVNDSWGPDGVEGKREDVEAACNKLIRALKALYGWEVSVALVVPDNSWRPVFDKLQFSSKCFLDDTEEFFTEFKRLLQIQNISGKKTLTFNFEFPSKLIGIEKDIKKAQKASLPKSQWDDVWVEILKKLIGA